MRLESPDGYALELRILGYEYPGGARDEYDANWLYVAGRVEHPRGNWSFHSACLLTSETALLADWLEAVGRGHPGAQTVSFIEPCLKFEHVPTASGRTVRAFFELEARPSWAPSNFVGEPDCFIEFPVSELLLQQAAASLREQLSRYPERAAN